MMAEGSVASTKVVRGQPVEKEHPGYRSYAQARRQYLSAILTDITPQLYLFLGKFCFVSGSILAMLCYRLPSLKSPKADAYDCQDPRPTRKSR